MKTIVFCGEHPLLFFESTLLYQVIIYNMIIIALSFSVNWLAFTIGLVKSLCGEPLMGPVSLANKMRKRVKTQQTHEFSWNLSYRIYFQKYLEVLVLLRLLLSSYSCWPSSCLHWIAPTEYFTASSLQRHLLHQQHDCFLCFRRLSQKLKRNTSPIKGISDKVC